MACRSDQPHACEAMVATSSGIDFLPESSFPCPPVPRRQRWRLSRHDEHLSALTFARAPEDSRVRHGLRVTYERHRVTFTSKVADAHASLCRSDVEVSVTDAGANVFGE